MRDTKRIKDFCNRLRTAWENEPDHRFGQLVTNIFSQLELNGYDPFFQEDDEMIIFIENYLNNDRRRLTDILTGHSLDMPEDVEYVVDILLDTGVTFKNKSDEVVENVYNEKQI